MTINNFKYYAPESFEHALVLLQGESSVLTFGDQALTGMLKQGSLHASQLVSIANVAGANSLVLDGDFICAGPTVTYNELLNFAATSGLNALSQALTSIADPHLLNNSTLGGALCYPGNSSGSVAAALAVLGAEMEVLNSFGESTVKVYDWLSSGQLTEAGTRFILKSLRIPLYTDLLSTYQNHRYIKSGLMSYGAAVSVKCVGLDITDLKIVLSGFEALPNVLLDTTDILMTGMVHTETLAEKIAVARSNQPVVTKGIAPGPSYLNHLYTVITKKAINTLIET